jgi:hypothetical protein
VSINEVFLFSHLLSLGLFDGLLNVEFFWRVLLRCLLELLSSIVGGSLDVSSKLLLPLFDNLLVDVFEFLLNLIIIKAAFESSFFLTLKSDEHLRHSARFNQEILEGSDDSLFGEGSPVTIDDETLVGSHQIFHHGLLMDLLVEFFTLIIELRVFGNLSRFEFSKNLRVGGFVSTVEESDSSTLGLLGVDGSKILLHEFKFLELVLLAEHADLSSNSGTLLTTDHNLRHGWGKGNVLSSVLNNQVFFRVEFEFFLFGFTREKVRLSKESRLNFGVTLGKEAITYKGDRAVISEVRLGELLVVVGVIICIGFSLRVGQIQIGSYTNIIGVIDLSEEGVKLSSNFNEHLVVISRAVHLLESDFSSFISSTTLFGVFRVRTLSEGSEVGLNLANNFDALSVLSFPVVVDLGVSLGMSVDEGLARLFLILVSQVDNSVEFKSVLSELLHV